MVFDKDVKGGALPPSHKTPYARVWHLQDGKLIYGQAGSTEEIQKRMKERADGKDEIWKDLEELLLLREKDDQDHPSARGQDLSVSHGTQNLDLPIAHQIIF